MLIVQPNIRGVQGSSGLRTVTYPLALSLLLVLPSSVSLTPWLDKAGGLQPSAHESSVEIRAWCLPSLFPGKDSSLLWGTLEQVRHLLSQATANPLCPGETSDQERVGALWGWTWGVWGGREGRMLCVALVAWGSQGVPARCCVHRLAKIHNGCPWCLGIIGTAIPLSTFSIPYGTVCRRE